jgi:predicted Zn-dependent protease
LGRLREAARSRAEGQVELLLIARESGCTRYARSRIHQNVHEESVTVYVRVLEAGRIGVVRTGSLDPEEIRAAIARAEEARVHAGEEPGFEAFPGPSAYVDVPSWFEATEACGPGERARQLGSIFREGEERGVEFAGAFTTGTEEVAVVNTNGVEAYQRSTRFDVAFTALTDGASGYDGRCGADIGTVDLPGVARQAMGKALAGGAPVSLDPGRYTVILEPKALAELLEWTAYIAFGAKSYQDETSFMHGRIGERIVGENISIYDDGLEPGGLPRAFDNEGVPKRRTEIIRKGEAVGVVYDTLRGGREGRASTGHAVLPDAEDGPLPQHVFLEAGDRPKAELIASTGRGVYVTRFHYVNGLLEPECAMMTGMTRDGTFLVEDGRLTRRVEEMRFTDSVLRMLSEVTAISSEREAVPAWWSDEGVYVLPAVRVDGFHFTGKTG